MNADMCQILRVEMVAFDLLMEEGLSCYIGCADQKVVSSSDFFASQGLYRGVPRKMFEFFDSIILWW